MPVNLVYYTAELIQNYIST